MARKRKIDELPAPRSYHRHCIYCGVTLEITVREEVICGGCESVFDVDENGSIGIMSLHTARTTPRRIEPGQYPCPGHGPPQDRPKPPKPDVPTFDALGALF